MRTAFAQALRALWLVLIPFGALGLMLGLCMRQMALETVTDEVRVLPFHLGRELTLLFWQAWGMAHRGKTSESEEGAVVHA